MGPQLAVLCGVLFTAWLLWAVVPPRTSSPLPGAAIASRPAVWAHAGGASYRLEVAATPGLQTRGLSNRPSLPEGSGMLFAFAAIGPPGTRCFWMKDMRFSVDMLWLDETFRVVDGAQRVRPGSYPRAFCPHQPAQYVVELPAGSIARTGIRPGTVFTFSP